MGERRSKNKPYGFIDRLSAMGRKAKPCFLSPRLCRALPYDLPKRGAPLFGISKTGNVCPMPEFYAMIRGEK
jgi:hypothetical protein